MREVIRQGKKASGYVFLEITIGTQHVNWITGRCCN